MKTFITHIMILPVENRAAPKQVQKGHERAEQRNWLGVFIQDGAEVKFPTFGLNFPPVTKAGAPWLSYQLAQTWGRRGRGRNEI